MGKETEDGDKCVRDRMLGKVRRIWREERWGVWMGREEGERGEKREIVRH